MAKRLGLLMRRALREASFPRVVAAVALVMLAVFLAAVTVSLAIVAIGNATHQGGHSGTTFIVTTTPATSP